MSAPEKPDIPGWFGLRQPWVLTVARPLGPLLSGVVILLFALAVAAAGAILLHAIFDLGLGTPRTGFGTGAVIVALLGAPFVIWRAVVAQRQADIAQEGLITDRINTAVQGLGAEKEVNRLGRNRTYINGLVRETAFEWKDEGFELPEGAVIPKDLEKQPVEKWENITLTEPNLEVRIGAIYALERVAKKSAEDHVQIMEILCAYIRQNAPANLQTEVGDQEKTRADVQIAIEVIGRRSEEQIATELNRTHRSTSDAPFRIDLRDVRLPRSDLSVLRLDKALFQRTQLAHSLFAKSWMTKAIFTGACLRNCNFTEADLRGALLHGADLRGMLFQGAQLQGASLRNVQLDTDTNLSGTHFDNAAIRDVDCTDLTQLSVHLNKMFGDASVTLPGGHGPEHEDWPDHWPRHALGPEEFNEEWRKWQADPEGYTPPDPPDTAR